MDAGNACERRHGGMTRCNSIQHIRKRFLINAYDDRFIDTNLSAEFIWNKYTVKWSC